MNATSCRFSVNIQSFSAPLPRGLASAAKLITERCGGRGERLLAEPERLLKSQLVAALRRPVTGLRIEVCVTVKT